MIEKYKASNSDGKQTSHDIIMGMVKRHLPSAVVSATMPATSFQFERLLVENTQWPILYMSEIDKDSFKNQKSIMKTSEFKKNFEMSDIFHENNNIKNTILKAKHKLNLIWLDYCGYLTMEKWIDMEEILLLGKLENKCVLSITLLFSRQRKIHKEFYTKIVKEYCGKTFSKSKNRGDGLVTYKEFKDKYFIQCMENLLKANGFQVKSKSPFCYTTAKYNRMVLYCFYLTK